MRTRTTRRALLGRVGSITGFIVGSLVAVSAIVFFGLAALPGDAASQALGTSSPERVAELRAQWGLDRPVAVRFLEWAAGLLQGDLGTSVVSGRPVAELLLVPVTRTLDLAAVALVGVLLVGLVGGILSGANPGSRADRFGSTGSLLAVSTPEFVLGSGLVVVVAGLLGWLPAVSLVPIGTSPWHSPEVLVLPALVITVVGGASLARLVRGIVAAEAVRPHVEAARLAGVAEFTVVTRHLLPGVVGPLAQACAQLLPYVLGGAVVVERLFGYPGLGSLLVAQVAARDTPTVQAVALILAAVVLAGFVLADVVDAFARRRVVA